MLRGRLLGRPIPSTGKLVTVQAWTSRGWLTFGNARARARDGKWSYRYTFTGTTSTARYRFRAVVPRRSRTHTPPASPGNRCNRPWGGVGQLVRERSEWPYGASPTAPAEQGSRRSSLERAIVARAVADRAGFTLAVLSGFARSAEGLASPRQWARNRRRYRAVRNLGRRLAATGRRPSALMPADHPSGELSSSGIPWKRFHSARHIVQVAPARSHVLPSGHRTRPSLIDHSLRGSSPLAPFGMRSSRIELPTYAGRTRGACARREGGGRGPAVWEPWYGGAPGGRAGGTGWAGRALLALERPDGRPWTGRSRDRLVLDVGARDRVVLDLSARDL